MISTLNILSQRSAWPPPKMWRWKKANPIMHRSLRHHTDPCVSPDIRGFCGHLSENEIYKVLHSDWSLLVPLESLILFYGLTEKKREIEMILTQ